MKIKLILAALFIGISAIVAQAQWGVGFKVGANLNTTSQPDITKERFGDISMRANFTGGMMVGYTFNRYLDADVELLFSAKSFNQKNFYNHKTPTIMRDLVMTSYYLEMPLMLKFYPVRELGLNIQAGANFGVLAYRFRSVGSSEVNYQYDITGDRPFNFGVNVGVGYEHAQGVFADLRYTHDLNDNFKPKENLKRSFREHTISLSVGYKF